MVAKTLDEYKIASRPTQLVRYMVGEQKKYQVSYEYEYSYGIIILSGFPVLPVSERHKRQNKHRAPSAAHRMSVSSSSSSSYRLDIIDHTRETRALLSSCGTRAWRPGRMPHTERASGLGSGIRRAIFRAACVLVLVSFFFPIPFIVFALLSLPPLVVTQIRGHIAGSSPPSPLRWYVPSFLSREEDFSTFFPRRLASNCAYARC